MHSIYIYIHIYTMSYKVIYTYPWSKPSTSRKEEYGDQQIWTHHPSWNWWKNTPEVDVLLYRRRWSSIPSCWIWSCLIFRFKGSKTNFGPFRIYFWVLPMRLLEINWANLASMTTSFSYWWTHRALPFRNAILVGGLQRFLFFHILGMSSSQLTKSIIFQRGRLKPPTSHY